MLSSCFSQSGLIRDQQSVLKTLKFERIQDVTICPPLVILQPSRQSGTGFILKCLFGLLQCQLVQHWDLRSHLAAAVGRCAQDEAQQNERENCNLF